MPFEAILIPDRSRSSTLRTITVVTSVVLHGALFVFLTVRSFWHVDELAPPSVSISLRLAPLPLPAPPAHRAAAAAGAPALAAGRSAPRRPRPALVQPLPRPEPSETPPAPAPAPEPAPVAAAEAPAAHGAGTTLTNAAPGLATGEGSGSGGVGTTINGQGAGNGAAAAPARFLAEALAKAQRMGGAEPEFPPSLAKAGITHVVVAKICVDTAGAVDRISLLKHADPTLDGNVNAALHTWRYRPLMANGQAIPFCTFVRFEFRGE